jgi:BlaI family transcriptional regulator, penicillinase repressor
MTPNVLGFTLSEMEWQVVNEQPTGRELDILKVLWEHGACSVKAVHRHLDEDDLAYNTVQTMLRIMEDKGLVGHHVEGRAFIYAPRYSRDDSASGFLDRVFDGAASQMVLSLLRAERISPAELDRMRTMIDEVRRGRAKR